MYNYDTMYMLKRQVFFAIVGFVMIIGSLFLDISLLVDILAKPIYILGYGCIFLLCSPVGVSNHGATRWINLMGVQFQVAEVVKISVIVILAYMVKKHVKHLSNPKLTIRMWLAGGIPTGLLFFISNSNFAHE